MTPFFSVVVPVYNVEPWLRQCVDSILAQTFGAFELILVDDGSPDGCGAICDAYARADSRVRVLHQQNAGLVSARRAGLFRASAEYVCFVDSDDWVVPRWLETVKALIERGGRPDIVLTGLTRDTGPAEFPILAEEGYYDKARLEREIYPYMLCDRRKRPFGTQLIPAYMVERVCKRQLLLDHYIPDGAGITLFEDIAMAYECMYYASSMYICRQALYVYRYREQSLLNGFRPHFIREAQRCFDYVHSRLGGRDPALDGQINAARMRKILVGVTQLIRRAGSDRQAADALRAALLDAGGLRNAGLAGLPWDMKLYLLLLKCRLYRLVVFITRHKM